MLESVQKWSSMIESLHRNSTCPTIFGVLCLLTKSTLTSLKWSGNYSILWNFSGPENVIVNATISAKWQKFWPKKVTSTLWYGKPNSEENSCFWPLCNQTHYMPLKFMRQKGITFKEKKSCLSNYSKNEFICSWMLWVIRSFSDIDERLT